MSLKFIETLSLSYFHHALLHVRDQDILEFHKTAVLHFFLPGLLQVGL